jgi:hypothetical protein
MRILIFLLLLSALAPAQERLGATRASHPDLAEPRRDEADRLTSRIASAIPSQPARPAPIRNFIDEHIFGKTKRDGVPHAGLATDAEFLRRVHLDLTGRLPEPDAIRKFVIDDDPAKRDKLIDQLITTPYLHHLVKPESPFLDRWTYFLADLMKATEKIGRNLFYDYLYAGLLYEVPYNEMVRDLLTARTRSNWTDGPSNFLSCRYVEDDSAADRMNHEDSYDEMAISASKLFLGISLECVSCHDGRGHLEKINLWLSQVKRERTWQQAAFFSQIKVEKPRLLDQEFSLLDKGKGFYDTTRSSVLRIPRYKADVSPRFLLSGEGPRPGEKWRDAYARMLTSDPQFARATVNLLWAELMGVGIVDPPFEFDLARQDPKNPPPAPWTVQPTHPELLDALAKDFVDHHYDLRRVIRNIVTSSAYQLSSRFEGEWKDSYSRYFARHFARRLPAEMIADAVSKATGLFEEISVAGTTTKVKYVMQSRSPGDMGGGALQPMKELLINFGQSPRERDKNDRDLTENATQCAELLNGRLIKEQIQAREGGRLHKLLTQSPPLASDRIAEEMFLAFLARFPQPAEKALAARILATRGKEGLEDLAWTLINRPEFRHTY